MMVTWQYTLVDPYYNTLSSVSKHFSIELHYFILFKFECIIITRIFECLVYYLFSRIQVLNVNINYKFLCKILIINFVYKM